MIANIKAQLRKEALAKRDSLADGLRLAVSEQLSDWVNDICHKPQGLVVSGFWPIRSEIDPRPLMAHFAAAGAELALPAIIDAQSRKMIFRRYQQGDQLISMGFGTCGPVENAAEVYPDIMLMPLAAFDASGNRIGYGAGYYDRAIAAMLAQGHSPYCIGMAFDCQKVAAIPAAPHDIALDAILTESGLVSFS